MEQFAPRKILLMREIQRIQRTRTILKKFFLKTAFKLKNKRDLENSELQFYSTKPSGGCPNPFKRIISQTFPVRLSLYKNKHISKT
jgi:hypothetical protein